MLLPFVLSNALAPFAVVAAAAAAAAATAAHGAVA